MVGYAKFDKKVEKDVFIPDETVYEDILFAAGERVYVGGQMKDDVYLAGAMVTFNGTAEEDLFIAGAMIEIKGVINGNLFVAGSEVIIDAEVKGNLRVVGSNVKIRNKVGKNLMAFGALVNIDEQAEVGKSLVFGVAVININNKINKNLYGGGADIVINNEVGGNAYITVDPEGELVLYPKANIMGNLEYTAKYKAEIKAGAQINGDEKFSEMVGRRGEFQMPNNMFKKIFVLGWVISLFGILVVGLLIIYVFKEFTLKVNKGFEKNILLNILYGLVFLIVTPIALVILAITIIGLPLALILGICYIIFLYICKVFVGVYIGEKIIKQFNSKKEVKLIYSMVLGLVLIYLVCLIPIVGWIVKLVIVLWALGVLLTVCKKHLKLEDK